LDFAFEATDLSSRINGGFCLDFFDYPFFFLSFLITGILEILVVAVVAATGTDT
jgi:hypothetical protein